MPDDIALCADGLDDCPRADQCARTLPSSQSHALYVYFWMSLLDGQQCSNFVPREVTE